MNMQANHCWAQMHYGQWRIQRGEGAMPPKPMTLMAYSSTLGIDLEFWTYYSAELRRATECTKIRILRPQN